MPSIVKGLAARSSPRSSSRSFKSGAAAWVIAAAVRHMQVYHLMGDPAVVFSPPLVMVELKYWLCCRLSALLRLGAAGRTGPSPPEPPVASCPLSSSRQE